MLVSISLPSSDARPWRSESNGEFAEVCAITAGRPFRAYFNERTERLQGDTGGGIFRPLRPRAIDFIVSPRANRWNISRMISASASIASPRLSKP